MTTGARGAACAVLVLSIGACSRGAEALDPWTDENGQTASPEAGDAHCDQESVTVLRLSEGTYVRDPDGLVPEDLRASDFERGVDLPETAVDTGLSNASSSVWLGEDPAAVYVVSEGMAERWPALTSAWGCD